MARGRYRRRSHHRRRIRRDLLGLGHRLHRAAGPLRGGDSSFEGLLNAFWLFAGPLAAIIVRKPGAALFAETLAAALELTMGNQWGVGGSLIVGIVQGLGAEIGLAIFAYKKWDLLSTTISGALAASAAACTTGLPIRLGARYASAST